MPWWSWILLWIALVALSLLFYAFLGFRLFRQIMATLKELGEAGSRLGGPGSRPGSSFTDLDPDAGSGDGQYSGRLTQSLPPGLAVFASPEQMRHEYHAGKAARQERRRARRVQRKADRGQPQRLRDIEFS
ncbi:hypothetical protein [Arthrobacter sp.]|uniref:hypothetical protein n=1 Tax=Arthrobacter sp. TaxID=1667 RepID=UPI002811EAC9|nr:hypothetical protein [Arthrobacter sp.]